MFALLKIAQKYILKLLFIIILLVYKAYNLKLHIECFHEKIKKFHCIIC